MKKSPTTDSPLRQSQPVETTLTIDPTGNLHELYPYAGVHTDEFVAELVAEVQIGDKKSRIVDIFRRDFTHYPSELIALDGRHYKPLKKGKYLKLKGGVALMNDPETGSIIIENVKDDAVFVTAHMVALSL